MNNNKLHSSNTPSASGGGGTSDATAANQVTGNNSLASIDSKTSTVITEVSGVGDSLISTTLNPGLSVADLTDGVFDNTSQINAKLPAGLGQSSMLGSLPVVIANNQTPIPITRTLTNPTLGTITTASGTVTVTSLNDTGAVTATMYGTYAGVNITFEVFNGTNWNLVPGMRTDGSATIETASGALTNTLRTWNISPLLGFSQFRIRSTAYTSGTANIILAPSSQFVPLQVQMAPGANNIGNFTSITSSITPGVGAANAGKAEDAVAASGDTGMFPLGVRRDTPTVSSSATGDYNELAVNRWGAQLVSNYEKTAKTFSGSAVITVGTIATDIAILPGNATNSVYVTKISVSGIATAAGSALVQLVKRSTANTGGTSTAITSVAHDNADTAVSLPLQYTTNPTTGTLVGNLRSQYLGLGSSTVNGNIITWEFADKGKHILLSGVAQGLAVNLNGVTPAGAVVTVYYEWIEI